LSDDALAVMLAMFAVNIPMLFAFAVAGYQRGSNC
jgi:hypothetical protein